MIEFSVLLCDWAQQILIFSHLKIYILKVLYLNYIFFYLKLTFNSETLVQFFKLGIFFFEVLFNFNKLAYYIQHEDKHFYSTSLIFFYFFFYFFLKFLKELGIRNFINSH